MATLLDKILNGDQQAVATFYTDYSPKIFRYLTRYMPEEEAKELVNDVFLEAIDSLPTLRKQTNVVSWLYKIAHNKMVDSYRKKKIKTLVLSQLPFLEPIAKEFDEPEFILEKNKIRDNIEAAIHSISKKYQKILRLHYEENIPVKELAIIFNLSPKATESLLYRARQSFIKAYERT